MPVFVVPRRAVIEVGKPVDRDRVAAMLAGDSVDGFGVFHCRMSWFWVAPAVRDALLNEGSMQQSEKRAPIIFVLCEFTYEKKIQKSEMSTCQRCEFVKA